MIPVDTVRGRSVGGALLGRMALAAAFLVFLAALSGLARAADDKAFASKAPYAFLLNYDTGTVLYEKASDKPFPPASLAKLMTMTVVFDAVASGSVSLDAEYKVSEHAWRTGGGPSGGSAMFVELNSTVRLGDLIQGVIIQSGNDAAIVIAEGMAGSEAAFADLMNKRAAELGLKNSHFLNPTGLDAPGMVVTARELAMIANYLIGQHPDLYKIYSRTEFTWNDITQRNRNPLLRLDIGADGLKTGYTKESGYGLVASTVQNGQRLIAVVAGLDSEKNREEEAKRLIEWGYQSFEQVSLFEEGESAGEARVYGGATMGVPLVGKGPVRVVLPKEGREELRARILYRGPLPAPVEKGAHIATLQILRNDAVIQETPLFAGADVPEGGLMRKATDAALELMFGWIWQVSL